jgi:hypothetical protein
LKHQIPISFDSLTMPIPRLPSDDGVDRGNIDYLMQDAGPTMRATSHLGSNSEIQPLVLARERSTSARPAAVEQGVREQAIEWLKLKAANTDGYDAFIASRGRVQHNPDVVKNWTFAAEFHKMFLKATTGMVGPVC